MASKRAITGLILASVFFLAACNLNNPADAPGTIGCDTIELINAIEMANNTKAQVAINLEGGCSYDFNEPYIDGSTTTDSALPAISSPIIIHGNGATFRVISTEQPFFRGMRITANGSLTINNLHMTIGDGYTGMQLGGIHAGGMIFNQGGLAISNSTIIKAFASSGGAISNTGVLELFSTEIRDGYCDGGGAAIANNGGQIVASDSTFANNYALFQGGAIWSEHVNNGDLVFENSLFIENRTKMSSSGLASEGGAIYAKGSLSISGSTFQSNQSGGPGGAIFHGFGNLQISSSSFLTNSAPEGGAVYHRGSVNFYGAGPGLSIRNSDFVMNQATNHGGAIYITMTDPESTVVLENNTVSQNFGSTAVYNSGPILVRYNTITLNDGIAFYSKPTLAETQIEDSIIANNRHDCEIAINLVSLGTNIDSDGTCTGFSLSGDPLLEPLANNGGPTLTHALPANSPVVDAATGDCPPTDQRGEARPGGSACDLGAYESGVTGLADTSMGDIPELDLPDGPLDPPPDLSLCVARVEELVPCNEGPGDAYPTVNSIRPEGIVEVTGQSINGDYAVIRNPCFPELGCWVKKSYLIFYCDDSELQLMSTPALDQPEPDRSSDGPSCNPGASSQSECEAGGGAWVIPLTEAPYCSCP